MYQDVLLEDKMTDVAQKPKKLENNHKPFPWPEIVLSFAFVISEVVVPGGFVTVFYLARGASFRAAC